MFVCVLQSRASSTSSLASPLSSASLAISNSGSFTGGTGLKSSSLPVMLLQTPNLALYREQLLQQSAMLAQQQQQAQAQAQQQQQQWAPQQGLARSSTGPSSGGSTGSGRKVAWAPKKTAADLFTDPSSVNSLTETPDLLGMFGGADSSFSDYDSHYSSNSNMPARQPVDAERVQALLNAVYGGAGGADNPAAAGSSTPASQAAVAGQASSSVTQQPSASAAAAGTGSTRSSLPQQAAAGYPRAGAGSAVSPTGYADDNTSAQSNNRAGGSSRGQSPGGDAGYDPFGAGTLAPPSSLQVQQPASDMQQQQQQRYTAAGSSSGSSRGTGRSAAAAGSSKDTVSAAAAATAEAMPDAFGAAAMQAAAAAFAAAGADQAWGGSSGSEQGGDKDPNALLGGPPGDLGLWGSVLQHCIKANI